MSSVVSEQQLMETAEKLFQTIDTNGNGKLEENEVREFSRQMLLSIRPDAPFDEAAFQVRFAELDKNHDGTVSKQELFQSLVDKARASNAL